MAVLARLTAWPFINVAALFRFTCVYSLSNSTIEFLVTSHLLRKRTTSKFTRDTAPRSRSTFGPAASSCARNSARCSVRMRPISLIVVHRRPGVVSILNVTRFASARRGPLQNLLNNLESDREICPSLGNCSDPGEKSAALLHQLISFDCSETG